ncbi:MAG: hypothetical protein NTW10_06360 [Bacteroidetes bacterium]|nr:hypothetical protein [Bacteroidota bacterium]
MVLANVGKKWIGCSMLDAGCWMLDAGCWMLDARCWMLDAGCWMLDAGCVGVSVCGSADCRLPTDI